MTDARKIEARTLTREWGPPDWPYPPDATVVIVSIDGLDVAEVIVGEEPRHRLDGGGTRPKITMRGVEHQHDPEGLGFSKPILPTGLSFTGARVVEPEQRGR